MPAPVDQDGLEVQWASRHAPHARLAHVTPANQFPMGIALSLECRMVLLKLAAAERPWIAGYEYDVEYRYSGRFHAALQSLDRSESFIHAGTFTKRLFNSLRLSFQMIPPRLVEAFAAARSLRDRHPLTLDQAILTEFSMVGHFGHHVRHTRQVCSERISALAEAAHRRPGNMAQVVQVNSGMQTVAWLRTTEKDASVSEKARSRGLEVVALSQFTICHSQPDALIQGFASCDPAELRLGVDALTSVLVGK